MHTVTAAGIELTVVQLHDRRQSPAAPIQQWCFQSELENYLYANWQTKERTRGVGIRPALGPRGPGAGRAGWPWRVGRVRKTSWV